MAIIYAYSGAAGANNGTSWTDAYTSLTVAMDAWTAGNEVWVAHDHTQAGTNTINVQANNSTRDLSIIVLRVNRTTNLYSPTTGLDTKQYNRTDAGADIDFSENVNNIFGSMAGLFFSANDNMDLSFDDTYLHMIDCYFELNTSDSRFHLGIRNEGTNTTELTNCTVDFTNAGGGTVRQHGSVIRLNGVTFKGTAGSSGLFNVDENDGTQSWITGCDFTGIVVPILVDIDSGDPETNSVWHFIACKFKVGQVIHDSGFGSDGSFIFIHNTDSAGNTYVSERYGLRGDIQPDLTTYYNGNNHYIDLDANTHLSHKMTILANTSLGNGLASLDIYGRFTTTGAKTLTIELMENFTTALTKRECWLEVFYLGQANSTLWLLTHDREFAALSYTPLAAGSGLSDWVIPTAGARSAVVSTTINVQKAGAYKAVLHVANYEAGKLVYYNPKITIT